MPKPDFKAIRARLEAATPGPWEWNDLGEMESVHREKDEDGIGFTGDAIIETDGGCYGPRENDRAFIANAPTDIAALLDWCEKLEDVVKDAISNSPGILLTEKSIKTMGMDTNEGPSEDPDA
jgi:hypothetical protein